MYNNDGEFEHEPEPIALSLGDAARRVGTSYHLMRHAVRHGGLRGFRLGSRRWFVRTDELRDYIARLEAETEKTLNCKSPTS